VNVPTSDDRDGQVTTEINAGDACVATRDILIDGRVAFSRGERAVVERIDPNAQRPQYRYVVMSSKLGTWYQLSEADIRLPEQPVGRFGRNKAALWLAVGLAAIAVVVIVIVAVLAGGGGNSMSTAGALICIDAGHGGSDTGAVENGVTEKDVNLDIALRARQLLEGKGYRVVMTREADVTVTLARRCAIAQEADATVLLSIHNNSRPPDAAGTTTYYYRGSPEGGRLAAFVQSEVAGRIRRPDRGLRESRLYMVRNVDMPSALLEGVFLSNAEDAVLIRDAGFRQQIADGVATAIDSYMKNR